MKEIEKLFLDYYTGGVPPGILFSMNLEQLKNITKGIDWAKSSTTKAEICFIGLIAYFEAFFKDQFAAIININPALVNKLKNNNYDISVNVSDIIKYRINDPEKFGFILAEKYEFGDAKKINNLYNTILNITPFSKDEKEEYDLILNDRNLIVHHGGIYTTKYSDQVFIKKEIKERVFFDSLVITKERLNHYYKFCENIFRKTMKATSSKLIEVMKENTIPINATMQVAIDSLDSEL